MAERISVYLDENSYRKLGDLKRLLEHDGLARVSISQAISYAILLAWRVEFVDTLDPSNWSDEVRAVVEKYAPASGGNGGDEHDDDPGEHFMDDDGRPKGYEEEQ